jgi:Cu-Zn family superoxide dismutase
MRLARSLLLVAALSLAGYASAADNTVEVQVNSISADGVGKAVGTIKIAALNGGVSITPNLHGFAQGRHAFHVHEKPNCGPGVTNGKPVAGLAAGPHYNGSGGQSQIAGMGAQNQMAGHGPMAMSMRGDLPELTAGADGNITKAITKKDLTLAELHGRSVMIHEYGEQPTEQAKPKGGGARVACAVIP